MRTIVWLSILIVAMIASPARAVTYYYSAAAGENFTIAQIDQTAERLVDVTFLLEGSIRFDVRAYGSGASVAPFQGGLHRSFLGTLYLGGASVGQTLAFTDGIYLVNVNGPIGTYIDYTSFPTLQYGGAGVPPLDGFLGLYSAPQQALVGVSTYDTPLSYFDSPTFSEPDIRVTLLVTTAPVPEPATWLCGILGFGVVGLALRSGVRRSNGQGLPEMAR